MTVKVGELLETLDGRLALELVAGVTGLDRSIDVPRVQQPGLALAGYLPQLHPDRMQVLGNSEVGFLDLLTQLGTGEAGELGREIWQIAHKARQ